MLFGLNICCLKVSRSTDSDVIAVFTLIFLPYKKFKSIRHVKKDMSSYVQGERHVLLASILGKALLKSFVFPTDIVAYTISYTISQDQESVLCEWIK